MSETATDDQCVSHDLHQDPTTKVTFDAGKPVRRTLTNT